MEPILFITYIFSKLIISFLLLKIINFFRPRFIRFIKKESDDAVIIYLPIIGEVFLIIAILYIFFDIFKGGCIKHIFKKRDFLTEKTYCVICKKSYYLE